MPPILSLEHDVSLQPFNTFGLPARARHYLRISDPAQLDSTLLYLVAPSSEFVTGTVVKVDDGQSPR